jgi:hypothetical protein
MVERGIQRGMGIQLTKLLMAGLPRSARVRSLSLGMRLATVRGSANNQGGISRGRLDAAKCRVTSDR